MLDKKNYTTPDFFIDPVNPTKEELTKWAFGNYYQPMQDFELFVVADPMFILSFAENNNCPTNEFFLRALYVFVGDAVRVNYKNSIKVEKIKELIKQASFSKNENVKKFSERSAFLVENPSSYNYEQWGWVRWDVKK